MITLDHIAVAGENLDDCINHAETQLGTTLPMGGEHAQMGTHNALCQVGPDTYLELIAPNPSAPAPSRPRWFGLDQPPAPPRLTAWVLRCENLATTLETARAAGVNLGSAVPFARDHLRWLFSLRDDGAIPLDGAAPMIIEWQTPGPHPANGMADLGLSLNALEIKTPQADALLRLCDALGLTNHPQISQGPETQLRAQISSAGRTLTLT